MLPGYPPMYVNEILPILCNRPSGGSLERPKNQYIISSSSLQQHNGMDIFEKRQRLAYHKHRIFVLILMKYWCPASRSKMSRNVSKMSRLRHFPPTGYINLKFLTSSLLKTYLIFNVPFSKCSAPRNFSTSRRIRHISCMADYATDHSCNTTHRLNL